MDLYLDNLCSIFGLSSFGLVVSLVLVQTLFCMISNSMLLNPNESSSSTVSLRSLQEILHNRSNNFTDLMDYYPIISKVTNQGDQATQFVNVVEVCDFLNI